MISAGDYLRVSLSSLILMKVQLKDINLVFDAVEEREDQQSQEIHIFIPPVTLDNKKITFCDSYTNTDIAHKFVVYKAIN